MPHITNLAGAREETLSDRTTPIPDYDIESFAREATEEAILVDEEWVVADEPFAEIDVVFDDEPAYPAPLPAPALPVLRAGSLRIAVADVGARHFSAAAERLLSIIDGKTPVRAVAMQSGLPYGEAITALRELFQDNVIALI